MEVARPMIEAEIRAREAQPPSIHPGVRREQETELERIKSLLGNRWHPVAAKHLASTGAQDGYAEIFVFPCCNTTVRDFLSTGEGDPPPPVPLRRMSTDSQGPTAQRAPAK